MRFSCADARVSLTEGDAAEPSGIAKAGAIPLSNKPLTPNDAIRIRKATTTDLEQAALALRELLQVETLATLALQLRSQSFARFQSG